VHKHYGQSHVVRGIDLHVPHGARCVLLGPSGCGKTTTLRMVAGLESPDEGEILLGDTPVAAPARNIHTAPESRGLGMVFQSYALWPHLSVFENVAYPLRRSGVASSQLTTRVHDALARVELDGLHARMPHALSGGQQQRVALARALVARPRVLLTDEPLSNLDARLRDGLRAEIASLCQSEGITLLHVTHDQAEALSLATHVAVMQAGVIAQLGAPLTLYREPASLYVATFMGDTHVLRGHFSTDGAVVAGVQVSARLGERGTDGDPCALALRPEHVELVAPSSPGVLGGEVVLCSCVGASHLLDVRTQAGTLRVGSPEPVSAGQRVGLRITHGHIFKAPAAPPP